VGVVLDSTSLMTDIVKIDVELSEPFIQVGILQRRNREYLATSTKKLIMQITKEEIERISKANLTLYI
jgi:hypothetical protein